MSVGYRLHRYNADNNTVCSCHPEYSGQVLVLTAGKHGVVLCPPCEAGLMASMVRHRIRAIRRGRGMHSAVVDKESLVALESEVGWPAPASQRGEGGEA